MCVDTYSTLRIFSEVISPEEITAVLQVKPTTSFCKGDQFSSGRLVRKMNGWFYSTRKLSAAKDTGCHIDLILAVLAGKDDLVQGLLARGCKADISSCWHSDGQGGPLLMPQQMVRLGALGIAVWWDVYVAGEDEVKALQS